MNVLLERLHINSYLFAVDQEHTGHGQLYQHQDEQQDEKLELENLIQT